MLRSIAVVYVNPSSLRSMSCTLGIGYGDRLIRLFSSRKSDKNRTVVLSFLGITQVGAPHSESFTFVRTPMSTSHSTSALSLASCMWGIGNGFAWYGFVRGFNLMSYGSDFIFPN